MSDAPLSPLARRAAELQEHFHSPFNFDGFNTKPPHVQRRFQRRLRLLPIPADLSGKTVLDVGAWDGYFSFEFERRGAKRVLAVDAWSGPHSLDAFLLAREAMNSKVEYQRLDAHYLSPEAIGTFDIVFCAGVLYHLPHPLLGLERIRSLTGNELILETSSLIPAFHESTPLITFFPGDAEASKFEWNHGGFPTRDWVSHALTAAGFARHEFTYTLLVEAPEEACGAHHEQAEVWPADRSGVCEQGRARIVIGEERVR
jgi:tRNA (mo5U34)-methyltransferase